MTIDIPKSHPRYESLMVREKIIEGCKNGIVADAGLIAHGRGEAFDYIFGEKTQPFALKAEEAAAAAIFLAEKPVMSVNGNVAVLDPEGIKDIQNTTGATIEVNLFYRTEERISRIIAHLESYGIKNILGANPDANIPGLDHARRLCSKDGIYSADLVIVALEDGDRVKALKDMDKTVVVIDLNPLSRSAQYGDITIVDNVTRALRNISRYYTEMTTDSAAHICEKFNNRDNLASSLEETAKRLNREAAVFRKEGRFR